MPHLHLLLNHVPTIGTVIALGLLILSFIRRNEGLRRVGFELFCIIALVTLPAYISGVGTQAVMEQRGEVSEILMIRHHDAAMIGSLLMIFTGGAAWLALWQTRRLTRASRGSTGVTVLLAVFTLVFMGRAATLGGEIRHPEILLDENVAIELTANI
jgi:uncharacterized membrane protein